MAATWLCWAVCFGSAAMLSLAVRQNSGDLARAMLDTEVAGTPTAIIVAGPTGSGKTLLAKLAAELSGATLPSDGTSDFFLLDDLVEVDPAYVQKVMDKLKRDTAGGARTLEDIFSRPTEQDLKDFGDFYFSVRNTGCQSWLVSTICKPGKSCGCNEALDEAITQAIAQKESFVFETTFTSQPGWLITPLRQAGYKVVVASRAVDFCELVQRNQRRALANSQAISGLMSDSSAMQKVEQEYAGVAQQVVAGRGAVAPSLDSFNLFHKLEASLLHAPRLPDILDSGCAGLAGDHSKFRKLVKHIYQTEANFITAGCTDPDVQVLLFPSSSNTPTHNFRCGDSQAGEAVVTLTQAATALAA